MKNCGICKALFEVEVEATQEHSAVHTMRNTDPEARRRQKEIVDAAIAAKEQGNG